MNIDMQVSQTKTLNMFHQCIKLCITWIYLNLHKKILIRYVLYIIDITMYFN